ncbi:MAG: TIR domain-containing protein [Phenylobacterium sp.]
MADVFISYASSTAAKAQLVADALRADGNVVWWDEELPPHRPYAEVIEERLRIAKAVVVLWSADAVRSEWVRSEADRGRLQGKLVQASLDATPLPMPFDQIQSVDIARWDGDRGAACWKSIAASVHELMGGGSGEGRHDATPTLAVLPFTNRSGLAEDDAFAEAMAEDLVAALAQVITMRVQSGVAAAELAGDEPRALAELGRRLDVRYVLKGNVRRVGENLRVSTLLLEAATGEVLHPGQFERPLNEVAQLQDDLVVEVADALNMQVMSIETRRALQKSDDLTAWESTRRSMDGLSAADDKGSLLRAVAEAERAVAAAPDYSHAHSLLAATSAILYFVTSPDDPAEVERIRAIGRHAVALAPEDPFTLANVGGAMAMLGLAKEALVPLGSALRKAPNLGPVHFSLGTAYCLLDRPAEALRHLEQAERHIPIPYMLVYTKDWRMNALIRLGRWDEARAVLDENLALDPDYLPSRVMHAIMAWQAQQHDVARAACAALQRDGFSLPQLLTLYGRAYAGSAALEEILAALRALWEPSGR